MEGIFDRLQVELRRKKKISMDLWSSGKILTFIILSARVRASIKIFTEFIYNLFLIIK